MSAQDPQEQYIDFERDILRRSPLLEELRPNLLPAESPPPLVPYDPSTDSSEPEAEAKVRSSGKSKRRRGRARASYGDRVLIGYLGPAHSDVARHAGKHALDSHSESDEQPETDEEVGHSDPEPCSMSDREPSTGKTASFVPTQPSDRIATASTTARRDDFPMVDPPGRTFDDRHVQTTSDGPDGTHRIQQKDRLPTSVRIIDGITRELDVRPPPLKLEPSRLNVEVKHDHEDSIVTSPALGKYAITPGEAAPDAIRLPALFNSPPRSSPAGSPENNQALPSIRTTFPHLSEAGNFAAMSPMNRPSPGLMTQTPTSYHPSPHPGMSPPRPPSLYWRSSTRDSSISGSSEYTSTHSGTASTPGSSIITPSSTASYPTSMSTVVEHETEQPPEDQQMGSESENTAMDSGEGHFLAGSFKCNVSGCTAIPFQTQYLLNSHMNVHSTTRPHFCPVASCPRGVGGQGFKRKNEMIRHGLVHTSPGYICPFCADQQHKYPRPDNLQRHVRVHHVDRDRDDPLLRDVLNQRPEGGNRGRRRRMNS